MIVINQTLELNLIESFNNQGYFYLFFHLYFDKTSSILKFHLENKSTIGINYQNLIDLKAINFYTLPLMLFYL